MPARELFNKADEITTSLLREFVAKAKQDIETNHIEVVNTIDSLTEHEQAIVAKVLSQELVDLAKLAAKAAAVSTKIDELT